MPCYLNQSLFVLIYDKSVKKAGCLRNADSNMLQSRGFTLIQVSMLLMAASLVMVAATLPGSRQNLNAGSISVNRLEAVLTTLRQYQTATGILPCPADASQPIGSTTYGVAATNGGTSGNCIGTTSPYADTHNNIAIGMVPVKTLGLSNDYALDGFGRDISYAVDTNATQCWATTSLPGAITVKDNNVNYNSVVALISHGADGFGAWLPMPGITGTAQRLNSGSTDASEAANAQVATGTLTPNTTFANFVKKTPTPTFDDLVVYKNPLWNLSTQPVVVQNSGFNVQVPGG